MNLYTIIGATILLGVITTEASLKVNQIMLKPAAAAKCTDGVGGMPPEFFGEEFGGPWYAMDNGPIPEGEFAQECWEMHPTFQEGENKIQVLWKGDINWGNGTVTPFMENNVMTAERVYFDKEPLKPFSGSYWIVLDGNPDEFLVTYSCHPTLNIDAVFLYSRSKVTDEALMDKMYKIVEEKVGYTREQLYGVSCDRW